MVPGQEYEEITLVQSDIEGSTEIWEWLAPGWPTACLIIVNAQQFRCLSHCLVANSPAHQTTLTPALTLPLCLYII